MTAASRLELRLGHSPDPDDAFMWWPLTDSALRPSLGPSRFHFEPVLRDIQTLNELARTGELEITALSCAAWPGVRDRYVLTACGSSLGDGYGPKLVARRPMHIDDLRRGDVVLAVPGQQTSAFAAASMLIGAGQFQFRPMPFDRIMDAVAEGTVDAGLIIHEGQLTYADRGLHLIEDLGSWWTSRTGLPLPLGVNAVRRDLDDHHGPGTIREVACILAKSVQAAMTHRPQALARAMQYSSTTSIAVTDRFVDLYVNRWTLDFGPQGYEAVRVFLSAMCRAELISDPGPIDFIGGGC